MKKETAAAAAVSPQVAKKGENTQRTNKHRQTFEEANDIKKNQQQPNSTCICIFIHTHLYLFKFKKRKKRKQQIIITTEQHTLNGTHQTQQIQTNIFFYDLSALVVCLHLFLRPHAHFAHRTAHIAYLFSSYLCFFFLFDYFFVKLLLNSICWSSSLRFLKSLWLFCVIAIGLLSCVCVVRDFGP